RSPHLRASLAVRREFLEQWRQHRQSALLEQTHTKRAFELDAADLRHISQRTVVRTEKGEVEVEVPDRDEEQSTDEPPVELRASLKVQAKVVQLGATLGFSIWVPPSDRGKIAELLPATYHASLANTLPLNYDAATIKTIENIDVIWLQRRAI